MATKKAGPRHWESERLLSELVLERTRAAAARRAQREEGQDAPRPPAPRERDAQGSTSPRRIA